MKLKALDQISISAVKADSLRPGEEFEVGDDFGEALIKRHPAKFERISAAPPSASAAEKSEAPPKNKAIVAAPANKATAKGKGKAK